MLKKIALGLLGLVALLLVVIALQPAAFHIERSATIHAPADQIYARIHDLKAQNEWSPWVRMDKDIKVTYSGPPSGVGATSEWQSPQMGNGRLTVTDVKPNQEVGLKLEMLAPMEATNRVVFTLVPTGDATTVTWAMDGENNFIGKAFCLVVDQDQMIGEPFEQGLATLKSQSEARAEG
jgi:hypothetical protein